MITIVLKTNPEKKWNFKNFEQLRWFNNICEKEKVSLLEWVLKYYYLYVDGVEYVC